MTYFESARICKEKYLFWKNIRKIDTTRLDKYVGRLVPIEKIIWTTLKRRIRKLIAPVSNGRNFRRLSTLVYTPRPVSKGPYSRPFYPRRNVLRFRMLSKRLLSSLQELALSLRFLGACLRFPFFR